MRIPALLLAALSCALAAVAAPGDPDTAFGSGGVAHIPIQRANERADAALLPQSDGKVVAVGGSNGMAALARYNADGTLDATFGYGGLMRRAMPVGDAFHSRAAARQSDGRIVVAGICGRICLARFNANGGFDSSFDSLTGTSLPDGFSLSLRLAVAPDDRILVALKATTGEVAVYRFLPGGGVDSGFGSGGRVTVARGDTPGGVLVQPDGKIVVVAKGISVADGIVVQRFSAAGVLEDSYSIPSGSLTVVQSAILQPDGKILVGGATNPPSKALSTMLLRLLPNGTPDPSFGGGTGVVYPIGESILVPWTIALRPDGRIVMSLVQYGQGPGPFEAMQLDASGALDPSFGTGGRVTFGFSPTPMDFSYEAAVLPDGKLLLAGGSSGGSPPDFDFALARLTPSGSLDSGFGTGGLVATEFGVAIGAAVRSIREQGGKLTVLYSASSNEIYSNPASGTFVARLLANGAMDTSFNGTGQADATLGATIMAVQPDGKVLVAGRGSLLAEFGAAVVVRLTSSGSVDTTFGSSGRRTVLIGRPEAIEALPDGRVLVAGKVVSATQPDPNRTDRADAFVARLLADGSADSTFGPAGAGGIVRIPTRDYMGNGGQHRVSLAVQADGKVVVSGYEYDTLMATRLNADGSIDPGFTMTAVGYPMSWGAPVSSRAAMAHADGRVTLAGLTPGAFPCVLPGVTATIATFARVNASGGVDAQTAGAGFLLSSLRSTYPRIEDAGLDAQDRVVMAGSYHSACGVGSSGMFATSIRKHFVARFTPAGALDTRFGANGVVDFGATFSESSSVSASNAMSVGGNGRIVVSGLPATTYAVATLYAFQGGGGSAPGGSATDADGDGIPNSLEMAQGRDPFIRDNDLFGDARLFAMQQYRDFLGREGDAGGVDFWTNRLASGAQTRAQMAETFYNSPEFQGLGSPVVRLYFAYFLRIPDYGGLQYWMGRFRGGESLSSISSLFAASPEFVARYGALDNAGFVDRVYRNVLGRAPDSGGLAYWKGQLDAGMARGDMMAQFSESPEYRDLIGNEVYVTMMYVGMLRREPDPGGFSYWVGYMDAGNSGLALTGAFIGAPEYRARFLP